MMTYVLIILTVFIFSEICRDIMASKEDTKSADAKADRLINQMSDKK